VLLSLSFSSSPPGRTFHPVLDSAPILRGIDTPMKVFLGLARTLPCSRSFFSLRSPQPVRMAHFTKRLGAFSRGPSPPHLHYTPLQRSLFFLLDLITAGALFGFLQVPAIHFSALRGSSIITPQKQSPHLKFSPIIP